MSDQEPVQITLPREHAAFLEANLGRMCGHLREGQDARTREYIYRLQADIEAALWVALVGPVSLDPEWSAIAAQLKAQTDEQ